MTKVDTTKIVKNVAVIYIISYNPIELTKHLKVERRELTVIQYMGICEQTK